VGGHLSRELAAWLNNNTDPAQLEAHQHQQRSITCRGTEIVLHVRGDGCTLDDGTPIPDTVVERIAPSSFLRALIHDANGRPINASAKQRHPTARQKRVVKERDQACIDCGRGQLLEYDHNPDYTTSGHTIIDELETRCAPCHHKRHNNQRPNPFPQ
jgi:hypothetical protein